MIVWPRLRVDKDRVAAYKKELEALISTPSWRRDRKTAISKRRKLRVERG